MAKDAAKATKPEKKAEATQPAEEQKAAEEKKPAEPRPPADPRLKVLKKFYGKFLPKGELRDRYKALMERWNSNPEHGGVTVEELRKLLEDWRASREKGRKKKAKV